MDSSAVRLLGRVPFLAAICCIVAVTACTARPAHAQTTFTAYQGWELYDFINEANQTPGFNGTINLAGGGAGLGAGIFVANSAAIPGITQAATNVTLNNVWFTNNAAIGGTGAAAHNSYDGTEPWSGGGGMGGNGGAGSSGGCILGF